MTEEQNNKNTIQMLYYVIKTYDTGISKEDINGLYIMQQQLQAYKDKYSDLETDYAKAVENENTLRYTTNKYYNEIQAHKDKEDKLREELLIWGEVMNPKLQNKLLQILNDKVVE